MGANAQTSVLDFTNGQVLTGPQMDISAGTGVPVFATTVTRDAAFGGSNKVLAEGQTCYLESTNVVQYYDGAAWATVGPAAAGGLVFLSGAPFTTASTVPLAENTFSATYRNYELLINITANTTDSNALKWRGRTGGADNSNANYGYGLRGVRFSDGGVTTGGNSGGATAGQIAFMPFPIQPTAVRVTLFAPQLASLTSAVSQSLGRGVGDGASLLNGGSSFNAATQFDALSFYPASGTISGTYEVYGYAIS